MSEFPSEHTGTGCSCNGGDKYPDRGTPDLLHVVYSQQNANTSTIDVQVP